MNIFYLDEDIEKCSHFHTDRHCVKMILESAQLLCTALNVKSNSQISPYKTTHVNHPSSIWVRESLSNFVWVYLLMEQLNKEFMFRFDHDKPHLAFKKMQDADILSIAERVYKYDLGLTKFKSVVSDDCFVEDDPIESYRNYYRTKKQHLFSWTKRSIPDWIY